MKRPKKIVSPKSYDVTFRFELGGKVTVVTGKATISPGRMVLESTDPDYYPFLIVGNACEDGYWGKNNIPRGEPVNARWALVDGIYRGTWVEDHYDYEFSFPSES